MAAKLGSFRQSFLEKSKRRLLSRNGYSELGFGSSYEDDEKVNCKCLTSFWNRLQEAAVNYWETGLSDPRKVFFAAKTGLSLAIVSMLIFLDEPVKNGNQYSIWAILTVVVAFEFTVGFCASYAKLYPPMKPYEYGFRVFLLTYCIVMVSGTSSSNFFQTAFDRLLLIAIGASVTLVVNTCICPNWAGEDLHKLVVRNFMGVATSLEGCVNGYLQCNDYERVSSKILTYQASDDPVYSGYRSVMQSTSQEESLLGFAIWEPPNGPYREFNYPWKDYMKVSGALRHCAFMVLAMHGCILSEIRASPEKRQIFGGEIQRVCTKGAKVLKELGEKVENMEKLIPEDNILLEVHEAAEELQMKMDQNSHLLVNLETWEAATRIPKEYKDPQNFVDCNNDINKQLRSSKTHNQNMIIPSENMSKREFQWSSRISFDANTLLNEQEVKTYESASSLSLATFASLLIEFVARLQNLVDSFEELSETANFRDLIHPLVVEDVVLDLGS